MTTTQAGIPPTTPRPVFSSGRIVRVIPPATPHAGGTVRDYDARRKATQPQLVPAFLEPAYTAPWHPFDLDGDE